MSNASRVVLLLAAGASASLALGVGLATPKPARTSPAETARNRTAAPARRAILPTATPRTVRRATEAQAFADGFESGGFSAWSQVAGRASVQTSVKRSGSYAMAAPSGSTSAYVARSFAASDRVTVGFAARRGGGRRTVLLRLVASSLRISDDGWGRLYLSTSDGRWRRIGSSTYSSGAWQMIQVSADAAADSVDITVNGTKQATFSTPVAPETGVQLGDLETTSSGPYYFDDVTVTGAAPGPPPADTIPPTLGVSGIGEGQALSAAATVTATATDAGGVSAVSFQVDSGAVTTDTGSPYTYTLDPATLAAGSHRLTVSARDAAGNVATAIVNFSVPAPPPPPPADTTPPTLGVSGIGEGQALSAAATVTATATDAGGVSAVSFQVDSGAVTTDTGSPYTYTLDPATLAAGSHRLTVSARDAAGNVATAIVNFSVPAPPPPPPVTPVDSPFAQPTSFWYQRASSLGTDSESAAIVAEVARQAKGSPYYAPTINVASYSAPLYVVDNSVRRIKVSLNRSFTSPSVNEALSSVPVPPSAVPAGGTDGSFALYNKDTGEYWDFWKLAGSGDSWSAAWAGYFPDIRTTNGIFAPDEGSTATGLPLALGTMLISEAKAGAFKHALGIALAEPGPGYVYPANRGDGSLYSGTTTFSIPEGTRLYLPPSFDVNSLPANPPILRMMARAAQDYGLVVWDKAGCVSFRAEQPKPNTGDPWAPYFNGYAGYKIAQMFPWASLAAAPRGR